METINNPTALVERNELINEEVNNWAKTPVFQVDNLFSTFISETEEGNSHYANQWSRILGINYGILSERIKNEINPDTNNPTTSIKMHLAVHNFANNQEQPFPQGIWIYFEVLKKDGTTSTLPFPIPETKATAFIYDISNPNSTPPSQTSLPHARYGISPDLRNQLVYNWVYFQLPFYLTFYHLAPKLNQTVNREEIQGNQSWVRALSYTIDGNNLQAIQSILNSDGDTKLRVRFGINTADLFETKDLFTIILELDKNTEPESSPNYDINRVTYLDFVKACPPNCG